MKDELLLAHTLAEASIHLNVERSRRHNLSMNVMNGIQRTTEDGRRCKEDHYQPRNPIIDDSSTRQELEFEKQDKKRKRVVAKSPPLAIQFIKDPHHVAV